METGRNENEKRMAMKMDGEARTLARGGIRWGIGLAVGVLLFVGVWRIQNAVLAVGYILVTGGLVASALGRTGRGRARKKEEHPIQGEDGRKGRQWKKNRLDVKKK